MQLSHSGNNFSATLRLFLTDKCLFSTMTDTTTGNTRQPREASWRTSPNNVLITDAYHLGVESAESNTSDLVTLDTWWHSLSTSTPVIYEVCPLTGKNHPEKNLPPQRDVPMYNATYLVSTVHMNLFGGGRNFFGLLSSDP